MKSILVQSNNEETTNSYIHSFCERLEIKPIDYVWILKSDEEKGSKIIGIDRIKDMQKTLFLRPVKSRYKAIIFPHADLLTDEAQNALLKVLEEPPEHVFFILAVLKREALLPTILSRCEIIPLSSDELSLPDSEIATFRSDVLSLRTYTISESLERAEQLSKNKADALMWCKKMILATRLLLKESIVSGETRNSKRYKTIAKELQKTHMLIQETNANLRTLLEKTFLGLSEIE